MDESPIKVDQDRQLKGLFAVSKEDFKRRAEASQREASLQKKEEVHNACATHVAEFHDSWVGGWLGGWLRE